MYGCLKQFFPRGTPCIGCSLSCSTSTRISSDKEGYFFDSFLNDFLKAGIAIILERVWN